MSSRRSLHPGQGGLRPWGLHWRDAAWLSGLQRGCGAIAQRALCRQADPHGDRERRRWRLRRLRPRACALHGQVHPRQPGHRHPEHAGRFRHHRHQLDLCGRAQGRHRHPRHLQCAAGRAALRQPGGALRSAQARVGRQHLRPAEYLRHLAHEPDQDHRADDGPGGDRRGDRRDRQLRHLAEGPEQDARHQVQGDPRLQHDRVPPCRGARRGRRRVRTVVLDAEGLEPGLDSKQPHQRPPADRQQAAAGPGEGAAGRRSRHRSREQAGDRAARLSRGDRPAVRDAAGHAEGDGGGDPPRLRRGDEGSGFPRRRRKDAARGRSGHRRRDGADPASAPMRRPRRWSRGRRSSAPAAAQ